MDAEPPLDYLLDDATGSPGPPAGREELLAIVARSRHQRRRLAAVGMVVTLVVGGAGGWLASAGSRRSSGGTNLAAASPTTTVPAAPGPLLPRGVFAYGAGGPSLKKGFVRTTADGVTLRLYTLATPVPAVSACGQLVPDTAEVEISTANVAGQAFGLFVANAPVPFKSVSFTLMGVAEGAPVWVVAAETNSSAARVRARFAGGVSDEMAPAGGWVALARLAPAGAGSGSANDTATGTLETLDAAGKVVATMTLPALTSVLPGGKILPPPAPAAAGGVMVVPAPATNSSSAAAGGPAQPATTGAGSPSTTLGAVTRPVPPCKVVIPPVPPGVPAAGGSTGSTGAAGTK